MSLFSRDLLNMHRQMNSLFDTMHSTYGPYGDTDFDELIVPALLMDTNHPNGQSTNQSNNKQLATSGNNQALSRQGDFPSFGQMMTMSVDIHAEPDRYAVSCELPGVDKSTIDISADKRNHSLTIKAEKRHEFTQTNEKPGDKNAASKENGQNTQSSRIIRQERSYGMVQRSFRLSDDADLDHVDAKFENGVLKLNVPRTKQQQRDMKKILVN